MVTKKIMQSIRTKSRPSLKIRNSKPVEPVQMNIIYQSDTSTKKLRWLHLGDDEPKVSRASEGLTVLHTDFVVYLTFPSSSLKHQARNDNSNRLKQQIKSMYNFTKG